MVLPYGFFWICHLCYIEHFKFSVWQLHSNIVSVFCSSNFHLLLKVYGAFRMYVKVLLMWDSEIQIDGGGKDVVLASMLEARNLVVLRVCCLKKKTHCQLFVSCGILIFF